MPDRPFVAVGDSFTVARRAISAALRGYWRALEPSLVRAELADRALRIPDPQRALMPMRVHGAVLAQLSRMIESTQYIQRIFTGLVRLIPSGRRDTPRFVSGFRNSLFIKTW
jgi:hypothetical protein